MSKKFFSLLSEEKIIIAPDTKVIPSKEFSSLEKANNILKKVKKEAIEYKKEISSECEILKEISYKEGFNKGLESLNEKILKLDHEIKQFENKMQEKLLPIALQAAKKILGSELKLSKDRIVDIVIQALKPVTQHLKIKIFANKSDIEILEKNKDKIKNILEHVNIFSIEERDDIEKGGCMIETEAGIINAQLENQWKALEIAFEKFMKKG